MKKKTIQTIIKATLITALVIGAFFIGKSQAKTEIITPSIENYIECESFETFYTTENGNELHIIANNGNEYVFTK